ncbi:tetraacyldisaccharide 4'-kinase [Rickettsiales endosymbiont of Stachyamoeba lipophora]|uniref:tetraacyldisaccharide 4'-kinase n=1 Tax=Rickettsiales endosymbiont of Stachyamoeba lipophora TaxID=2486578 RepID=UPI000F648767|nr:tetraacyldisaccharide 4'-kinase [Rickettsiales endosymbiont of Stachyamoeba lipophora]AZL15500.1 tetraacyldisaccharide 4'-kinase [Rickettsiales endosymbiont of Stachyamoeba lipophora]
MNKRGSLLSLKQPKFWQQFGLINLLLTPISLLYLLGFYLRKIIIKPINHTIPIIVVGNLVVGGSGKTPITIWLYKLCKQLGFKPCILAKGYQGSIAEALLVTSQSSNEVGDEALILSKIGPTVISRDRKAGIQYIETLKQFDLIIMDDGLQNPYINPNFKIVVVDGNYKFGNCLPLPAGPLREPLCALQDIDAIISYDQPLKVNYNTPQFIARIKTEFIPAQEQYIAFAGIGRPEKFFLFLQSLGCNLKQTISFPDHFNYNQESEQYLVDLSKNLHCKLITTRKDYVKLTNNLQKIINVVDIEAQIDKAEILANLIKEVLSGKNT